MSKLKSCWLGMSIGSKMKVFVILLLLVIITDASFNFYTAQFSVGDVNQILKEISRSETAQDAMHTEAESLINAVDHSFAHRMRAADSDHFFL